MSSKNARHRKNGGARSRPEGEVAAPGPDAPGPDAPTGPTQSPLFYAEPEILRFPDHGNHRLRRDGTLDFARQAGALPLTIAEFAAAGRHYPIVFSSDREPMPLAVTGLDPDANLFIDADGRWLPGTYVPAYVRRYPFIAIATQAGSPPVLGFDRASPLIDAAQDAEDALPLFDVAGSPTEHAREAMNFCEAYAGDHDLTVAFGAALAQAGLLQRRALTLRFGDGTQGSVEGFFVIDEAAYRALDAERLAIFHRHGWLDLIVLHLASQFGWQNLADRRAARLAEAA